MDTKIIDQSAALSFSGKGTFPQVIMMLINNGVQRYMVDMVALKSHYYGINGETYSKPLASEKLQIAASLDATAMKAAVTNAQQNISDYQTFLHEAASAGCSHYEVFITGKKVIYFGNDGSHHTEYFPQGK